MHYRSSLAYHVSLKFKIFPYNNLMMDIIYITRILAKLGFKWLITLWISFSWPKFNLVWAHMKRRTKFSGKTIKIEFLCLFILIAIQVLAISAHFLSYWCYLQFQMHIITFKKQFITVMCSLKCIVDQ